MKVRTQGDQCRKRGILLFYLPAGQHPHRDHQGKTTEPGGVCEAHQAEKTSPCQRGIALMVYAHTPHLSAP